MGQLTFQATLGGSVNLVGPNTSNTVNLTLPSADGSAGQALTTNGSGTLAFGGVSLTSGVTGTLPVANGGTGVTTSTGSGSNVLSTSPTLVTPILGTPTSATLTNATGLPLTTGVTGVLPVANGGTGLSSTPANGQLNIGNGTGFTRATLTAGSGVTITNGAGSITIATSGSGSTPIGTDLSSTDYTLTLPTALASTTATPIMQTVNLDGTKQLMLFGGSSSLQAVVYDGTSFGTVVLVRSGTFNFINYFGAVAISSTSVLVSSVPGSTALETVVLSISGTTITVNTPVATTLSTSTGLIANNTRFVTCGSSYVLNYYNSTTGFPTFRAITVSGTTPTVGSELSIGVGTVTYAHSYAYTSSVLLSLNCDGTNLYAQPISVSGTTLTLGTSATVAVNLAPIVSGVLSTGRVAVAYAASGSGACTGAIVSVTGTIASISTTATSLTTNGFNPVMQVYGSQAFVLSGVNSGTQIGLLNDTAGVASFGATPITLGSTYRMVGYLGTGKVFLSNTTSGASAYLQYGISGSDVVLEKTFNNVTSTTTIATRTFAADGYYSQPLSGPSVSGNNSTTNILRTSAGKTAVASYAAFPFVITIDGTSFAKIQQNANYVSSITYNDAISTSIGWGLGNLQAASTTTLVIRKIVLS